MAETIFELLELIRELRGSEQQIDDFYKHIHGAGHSLGAYILGILGNKIQQKFNHQSAAVRLGRIYALDPAGPYFHERLYSESYLSVKSAGLVMVLHTTHNIKAVKTGLRYVIGHYDFYVYVAEGLDEWCPSTPIGEECEHLRALVLFKTAMEQTVNQVDRLIGFKCHALDLDRGPNVRDQERAIFGLDEPLAPRGNAYYLPINNQSPYNYVPNKAERDMKKCHVFRKAHPGNNTKGQVKDIKFTTERTVAGQAFRMKKDIKSWSNSKISTPSPFPITIEWDFVKQTYRKKEIRSNEPIGGL